MIRLIPNDLNIDFLKLSKPFVIVSTICVVLSIGSVFYPGLRYGIDFTGGAEIQIKINENWDIAQLRKELETGGVRDPIVVQIGDPKAHEFLVKVQAKEDQLKSVSTQFEAILKKSLPAERAFEMQRVDVVGPQAGNLLQKAAILSMLYAALGISIYIAFRFDIRFAPGILRALLFDVILTIGIWVLIQREFNLSILAALLTIAGYSCNDTIVIYDRIRDYSRSDAPKTLAALEAIVNRSINQNLGRTILTSICTLFVVVSLWLLGGPVLEDFAFCMMIGFTISIFSTIFVATPLVVFMEKRRLAQVQAAKA